MKRWNGWGEESISYPLPPQAGDFLENLTGPGQPPNDITLGKVMAAVPPSRLPKHRLISTAPEDRVRHARGQSLPDWIAMRTGRSLVFPDGTACPVSTDEITELLRFARETGTHLIPYGGGTSVVGHINPTAGDAPVLTVNMKRLNGLYQFDESSLLATFGAGIRGPDLEAQLRARGCTLGHYPQSFEYSTLGGWVAARSSGQQSMGYGRIEHLFAGGKLETPNGTLEIPCFPASAAGPDLRQIVLGSEGRLGFLTEVTVRVSRLPKEETFHGVFFPDFKRGRDAVRRILQARLPLSMMRLSTAIETETTLALAGHELLIGAMKRLLSVRGVKKEKAMLLLGFTGHEALVKTARKEAIDMARRHGGVHVGRIFGKKWYKNRFRSPYLRNTLWETGYAVDTLETAVGWNNVPAMVEAVEAALRTGLEDVGEKVFVFTHLSHLYRHGSSVYTTYIYRIAADPDETLRRWRTLKTAASRAILAHNGTISHQHGVGTDHLPYLGEEKGPLGMKAIRAVCKQFDPKGIMNPGKLFAGK